MCGVAGVFGPPSGALSTHIIRDVSHMLDMINHRGRDSQYVMTKAGSALGHCRLGITGTDGQQPMTSASGRFVAMVNGQFYNDALWQHYKQQGYPFQTDTDSELLLALWEDASARVPLSEVPSWVLSRLEGEFACVVWDTQTHTVWMIRDRFAIKPLCYTHEGGWLKVASEAKALLDHPNWDHVALMQALSWQYPSPHRTFFEGVFQVPPGSYVCATWNNGWEFATQRWFDLSHAYQQTHPCTPHEYLEILRDAVRKRLPPILPTAVHLSGGCDSSSILALARMCRDVVAYAVQFTDHTQFAQHDESHIAQHTARVLDVSFEKVPVSTWDLVTHWDQACWASERFGVNGHFPAKWLLSQAIHQDGIRVSLSGEGADEILLGYPFLQQECFQEQNIKGMLSQNTHAISLGTMLPHGKVLPTPFGQEKGWVPVWLQAKLSMGQRLHDFLLPSSLEYMHKASQEGLDMYTEKLASRTRQSSIMWTQASLSGYILPALADAPEAFHSIQGRVPFLDHDCVKAGLGLSAADLGFPFSTKQVLRDFLTLEGLEHVAQRPKHPFEAPPLLSCVRTRSYLKERFVDWSNTPIDPSKVHAFMSTWDSMDMASQQLYEPIVCTLLSIQSLRDQFL